VRLETDVPPVFGKEVASIDLPWAGVSFPRLEVPAFCLPASRWRGMGVVPYYRHSSQSIRSTEAVMKRWSIFFALFLVIALVGCQMAPASPTAAVEVSDEPSPTPVVIVVTATPGPPTPTLEPTPLPGSTLDVVGLDESITLSIDDLSQMDVVEGYGGIKSSTGKITPPAMYRGVSLLELCQAVGPCDESVAVNVVAKDGYAITFSYDQIANGTFTTFDPITGEEISYDQPLVASVVFEREGESLSEENEGTLRLAILSPESDQVTDGHWSVKWVRQVVVKQAVVEWSLHLEGAQTFLMDRNTFESGASPSCHQTKWEDDEGRVWTGIPLYYLAGFVDDENRHEGGAFNDELARDGYTIDVVAADGYKVTFDSQHVARNKDIILAYLVDDQPLSEDHFPLRLVGPDLMPNERVGQVAQIVLSLEPLPADTSEATEEPAEEPAEATEPVEAPEMEAGTLHLYGAVSTPLALTQADLEQIGVETLTVEHPKKGAIEMEGVRLSELTARAGVEAGAARVVFTSGDGYKVEVGWSDLEACADCLVTMEDESFNLVMPGMETSTWSKDVRLIEVKSS
jgi:DMSO/TMAO reductase YedYZ molybdopterin-dependent catalytic subunit